MITRRNLIALPGALALTGGLAACGGGKSTKAGNVRLVNATTYAAIDLRVSNANIIAAVAKGAVSGYVDVTEGTTAFQIGQSNPVTTLLTQSNTVSNNTDYTMVAYTTNSTLNTAYFADTESAPSSGTAKIRLFNGSLEAGSLDLFVVTPGQPISGATAVNAALLAQRVGSYTQVSAGSWRIVVTGAGDPADIRLDIPSVTLADQQIATLVATSSGSGLLVDGLLLNQGGTVTAYGGTSVRLRLVTSLTSNAATTVALNGTTIFDAVGSPSVENYLSVGADLSTLTVNGTAVSGLPVPAAGSDLTLIVCGTPATPTVKLLTDDNTLPTSSTKAKVRLVNLLNGQTESLSMTADFTQVASSIKFGEQSEPAQVTPTSTMDLVISTPSNAALATISDVGLTANHVYTVFMLESAGAPRAVVRLDR